MSLPAVSRTIGCYRALCLRSRIVVPEEVESSVCGDVRSHTIDSDVLEDEREYLVYLPPGYSDADPWRYPVLFLNDGQNVFDRATAVTGVEWQVDETAELLIREGKIPGIVIVAVYNTPERIAEYTPFRDPVHGGGGADRYARFLTTELMPELRAKYHLSRRPEDTAIIGSSLGGLCALYLGWRYPRVFGLVGALSPSLWWGERGLLTGIGGDERTRGPLKVWMDMGTEESLADENNNGVPDVLDDLRTLRAVLVYKGYKPGVDLFYREVEGGRHDEASWAIRVSSLLEALFPYQTPVKPCELSR